MAKYSRRLKALELYAQTLPQSDDEFLNAERRLREADDVALQKGSDKWISEVFRMRQAGKTMLEAMRRAKLPKRAEYAGRAQDEAIVQRHRVKTGWTPPLAEHTEEHAAEILERIYLNVIERIKAKVVS
jgi:hypothetical protein